MTKKPHQFHRGNDGSTCVRVNPGDPWIMTNGGDDSDAHEFLHIQNRFWKPWVGKSVRNHVPENRVKFVRRDGDHDD